LDAPKDAVFEAILRADWNGDSATGALALLRSTQSNAPAIGSIYFYGAGGEAKKIADLPGWLPSRSDCAWQPRVQRVGKSSAAVDLHLRCTAAMPSRTATRYLALIEPTRADPVLATWRMAEPAPDEIFDASVSGADLDGDGKDDATLTVVLTHVPTKREARAEFAWLDRTAGISRETGHFASSLGPLLAGVEKQASSRKTVLEALERTATIWRLLASACAESATARLFRADGSAMPCENLPGPTGRLVNAEIRAALTQGDVLRAAFAITRAHSMLGVHPSTADRTNWLKAVRKAVTTVDPIEVTPTDVRPVVSHSSVHFGPLHFQGDGTLLVQTARGITRVYANGQGADQDDASAAPTSWPSPVSTSDRRLESVLAACDRSELLVLFKSADGRLLEPIPTPFLAPRPGVCAGAASVNWRVSPIQLGEEALPTVLIEGACIANGGPEACMKPSSLGKVVAGSPRSPDGRRLVAQTGIGLVAIGGAKPELWAGERLGNVADLTECAIDNPGDHIACVRAGKLVILSKGVVTQPAP
jgi:hypothetical protein